MWRINEKTDGANTPKYKVILAFCVNRSKAKSEKALLELLIKVVDYMIQKFGLEKELLDMFD